MEAFKGKAQAVLYTLEEDESAAWAVATGIWKPDGAAETLNLLNFEWDFIATVFFCHFGWCLYSRQIQGNIAFISEEGNTHHLRFIELFIQKWTVDTLLFMCWHVDQWTLLKTPSLKII